MKIKIAWVVHTCVNIFHSSARVSNGSRPAQLTWKVVSTPARLRVSARASSPGRWSRLPRGSECRPGPAHLEGGPDSREAQSVGPGQLRVAVEARVVQTSLPHVVSGPAALPGGTKKVTARTTKVIGRTTKVTAKSINASSKFESGFPCHCVTGCKFRRSYVLQCLVQKTETIFFPEKNAGLSAVT